MLYKTIILEMLQDRPEMHEQLRHQRRLLSTLNQLVVELKTSHEVWKEQLTQANPGSSDLLIASQALEIAVKELVDRLPSAMPPDESEPLSLDAAMSYIRSHTPPA